METMAAELSRDCFVLGITGGSGSGKTTLLRQVEALGGVVLDCDAIYHRLLQTDTRMLAAIEAAFPGTLEKNGLNRKKLGEIVFSDPRALEELNRITHAAVRREVLNRLQTKPRLAAIDAIGLFEGALAPLCHLTVAVIAPREDRIARLMVRDGITREYAEKRIDAQHPDAWFSCHCDEILENNGDIDAFATKCVAFLRRHCIMETNP